MAKTSIKAREGKRERLVEKFAKKRAELKAAEDWVGLDKLPKNSSLILVGGTMISDDSAPRALMSLQT
jgi:hypothetical protein